MCDIYRLCLRNGILKVSQIQLSHTVAPPILIGDWEAVLAVARLLLLPFLCASLVTNRYPSESSTVERRRGGVKRDYTKIGN